MKKINMCNLSASEGETILKGVKSLIDVIVSLSGGKPWFGSKKK